MKIIQDGNIVRWLRVCVFLCGVCLGYVGLANEEFPAFIRLIIVLLGCLFVAIGGYASQAHMLKLKPFDNSYKKNRKSYDKDNGKTDV